MTTISQTWNNTCAICDKIALYFKKGLKKWQFARQMSANVEVAKHLVESGEYKNYHEALYSLNKRAKEYFKNA